MKKGLNLIKNNYFAIFLYNFFFTYCFYVFIYLYYMNFSNIFIYIYALNNNFAHYLLFYLSLSNIMSISEWLNFYHINAKQIYYMYINGNWLCKLPQSDYHVWLYAAMCVFFFHYVWFLQICYVLNHKKNSIFSLYFNDKNVALVIFLIHTI